MTKLTNSSYKSHLPLIVEIDGLQHIESFESFTEAVQTLICDSLTAVNKSTSSSFKSHLPDIEVDGFQGIESFESFTEKVQTLICDFVTAVRKSINSSYKSHSPLKVEVDGL